MAPRQTSFNLKWIKKYLWLSSVDGDSSKAFCKLCQKSFSISSKGEAAIKEHGDGAKHKEAEKSKTFTQPLNRFFSRMSNFQMYPK